MAPMPLSTIAPPGLRLFQLLADPYRDLNGTRAFLGSQYFSVMLTGPSGAVDFTVIEAAGAGSGYPELLEVGSRAALHVEPQYRYHPLPGLALAVTPFPAVEHILQALPSLTLPCDGGEASVLLTPQLSGCSLVYLPSTAARREVRIIHIQPIGLRDGAELQTRLAAAHPAFAGAPGATRIYGRNDCGATNVNILGLRQNGKWTLVLQRFVSHGQPVAVELLPLYE
jgi:hypothetical protein